MADDPVSGDELFKVACAAAERLGVDDRMMLHIVCKYVGCRGGAATLAADLKRVVRLYKDRQEKLPDISETVEYAVDRDTSRLPHRPDDG